MQQNSYILVNAGCRISFAEIMACDDVIKYVKLLFLAL
jgi:hypothetical protein